MKVLVTGGAGFIGSHLVRALAARGDEVTVLDSMHPQVHGTSPRTPWLDGARLVRGDVRDASTVGPLVGASDAVCHLAALTGVGQSMYSVREYLDVNVGGMAAVLEALPVARDGVRVVLTSSRAVYGEGAYRCARCGPVIPRPRLAERLARAEWEPTCPTCDAGIAPTPTAETSPASPASVYATSKLAQEQAALVVAGAYKLPVTVLRCFNVYGPGQSLRNPYTGVIAAFATAVLAGRAPVVYEDGDETRDFVHVNDVVAALVAALDREAAGGAVFNVGTGRPVPMFEVAQTVSRALGGLPPVVSGQFRVCDVRHCFADLTASRRVLGFTPVVAVEEGLHALARDIVDHDWEDLAALAEAELAARGLAATAVS